MRTNNKFDAVASEASETKHRIQVADLVVEVVQRRHVPIYRDDDGMKSYGQIVDGVISDALTAGEQIRSFTLEIPDDTWDDMKR